jgi:hypothetical protein
MRKTRQDRSKQHSANTGQGKTRRDKTDETAIEVKAKRSEDDPQREAKMITKIITRHDDRKTRQAQKVDSKRRLSQDIHKTRQCMGPTVDVFNPQP